MSTFNASEINILSLAKLSEEDARAMLERLRWPDGPVCPHCGVVGEAKRMESSEGSKTQLRDGVWNCRACRKPFTVTVGTIFEGSHIPLSKWLMGFYLFASSKKGISALQLQRQLDLGSYRTAWHMAHRIRHAMQNDPDPMKLSGDIEADETFIGGRPRNKAKGPRAQQIARKAWGKKLAPVTVLVQRGGGARARAQERVTSEIVGSFIRENVDLEQSALHTDEGRPYKAAGKEFAHGHHVVHHRKGEYARGSVHSNTVESFHGLFKRSINGGWHHISRQHLPRYLDEQCFRWTFRKVDDGERTVAALGRVGGVRLYYKRPTSSERGGESLVARG